ncbi:MAG: UDP-N-acetylenolpyruvoylglucosamine reductase [Syntrophorhabdus sp. PtaU1.Bin050]|nr:MAG: UDP-N-acetylenolpyruvoylglucosamine reductase [Syntrophorhabdus sp. PtaU1.Bin050]
MKRYTSMKVGGPVKYLVYPHDEEDLLRVLRLLGDKGVAYRFLGNGTNVIVHDGGLDEAVIRTTRIKRARYTKAGEDVSVEVSGGTSLKVFIRDTADRGLSGLERLFWIPGTVGGGVKMNAGSFGSWISGPLESICLAGNDGETVSISKDDMGFGYRTSRVLPSECVMTARFRLSYRDKDEIRRDMDYVCGERKARHPMEYPSAGSVFKGVDGEPAWKLIEKAGLKGMRIGGAMVSEKHANFIVNSGAARAEEVKLLIDKIKSEVFEKTGVSLKEEVELWGFNG